MNEFISDSQQPFALVFENCSGENLNWNSCIHAVDNTQLTTLIRNNLFNEEVCFGCRRRVAVVHAKVPNYSIAQRWRPCNLHSPLRINAIVDDHVAVVFAKLPNMKKSFMYDASEHTFGILEPLSAWRDFSSFPSIWLLHWRQLQHVRDSYWTIWKPGLMTIES